MSEEIYFSFISILVENKYGVIQRVTSIFILKKGLIIFILVD